MTEFTREGLLTLLPALYRIRDGEAGGALIDLLGVLADQLQVLESDLDQLYDDQFVETCADWATPYVGDLIGYRPMYGQVPAVASPRADVANTIRYRRRKGTALILEQLAHDVTQWPAREVEFFQRVAWAQYANHVRPEAALTPDLRSHESLADVGGAFDDLPHVVDVRNITTRAGFHPTTADVGGPGAPRHHIRTVGVFLWRIGSYPLDSLPLTPDPAADGLRFRLDPLGRDLPIYTRHRPVETVTSIEVADVSMRLTRRRLYDHPDDYYGTDASLVLTRVGADGSHVIDAGTIRFSDLSDAGGGWAHRPPAGSVALDPALGRVYLGDPAPPATELRASWYYGEAVPVGAGSRDRIDRVSQPPQPPLVLHDGDGLVAALTTVAAGGGDVRIDDSRSYQGPASISAPAPPAGKPATPVRLTATNRTRPVVDLPGPLSLAVGPGGSVELGGVLITGGAICIDEFADNSPRSVVLRDCTLVPGHRRQVDGTPATLDTASLVVLDSMAVVTLERCIVGPIVAVQGAQINLVDCIVDADGSDRIAFTGRAAATGETPLVVAGPADQAVGDGTVAGGSLSLSGCTVIGRIHADTLDASNCLLIATQPAGSPWRAPVWVRRRQQGCVRFSWLPDAARTGRRYHCQPAGNPHIVPTLTSTRFGDAGYCQVAVSTPDEIRRGADDQSEMGVTHSLFVPQREDNLRIRLTEYLRFGLQAGFCYAS